MCIGEGGVEVDDGDSGIDEKNAAHIGAGTEHVGRRLVEIGRQQSAHKLFRALLASGGHGNLGRFGAEYAFIVVRDK